MSAAEEAGGKAALRAEMLHELRQLTPEDRAVWSTAICRRVLEHDAWIKSAAVVLFSPMRGEPDIAPLAVAAHDAGKQVVIIPSNIRDEATLQLPFAPEVIVVPGLAFSGDGHRLGRGGGFYDRLLAGRARGAFKFGVCFRFQLGPSIPHEQHDISLDVVVTD